MNKKVKNRLISISIILIVIAIVVVVTQLIPPTVSTDNINSKFDDVTIEGLRFTNVNIVGNQLTALIQNTKSTKDSIKTITVKFFDKNNNEIESVDAYIGGKIEANEMKNLDVKTDADLSNIGNITYQINRSSCLVTYAPSFTARVGSSVCRWNYSFSGTYECNGVTGHLISCIFNGTYKCGYPYNSNYSYSNKNLDTNCCNGNYRDGNTLYFNRCGNNFYNNETSGITPASFIPNEISCSCDE